MNEFLQITSSDNPKFKRLTELLQSKGVEKYGETLVCGEKITSEIARDFDSLVLGWITPADGVRIRKSASNAPKSCQISLSKGLFRKLDVFGTDYPLLWVKTLPIHDCASGVLPTSGLSVVVPFQNPDNVGAVVRSAAAFGAKAVLLSEEAAHPFHPKSIRASVGAVFRIPLLRGGPLGELPLNHDHIMALSGEGEDIRALTWPDPCYLIPGIEGPGLPSVMRRKVRLARIPIEDGVESLNGMVATSIALFEWRRTFGN